MNEIKCPNCGTIFKIDENNYASIVKQVRDKEFEKEILSREKQYQNDKENALKLEKTNYEKDLNEKMSQKDLEIANLKNELKLNEKNKEIEVKEAIVKKDKQIDELSNEIKLNNDKYLLENKNIKENYEAKLKDKDEQISYYKDLKARQSTKMVGETLEQHCQIQFNSIRATAFPNAYFEKDNDIKTGSKGDFIFRDYEEIDGEKVEYISIMFEMKNENETTQTKHKNEDFFKELDKDRREKKCEYAVLVSMLEEDNDLYNNGIVDVSYKYPKMYVIRPQFFIPIISILRNTSRNSLESKKELIMMEKQNIDTKNFEDKLIKFKDAFGRNYRIASEKFSKAIDEIDKSINHLQKIKDALISSENNLRLANNKAEDLSIKKLTADSPSIRKKFEDAN